MLILLSVSSTALLLGALMPETGLLVLLLAYSGATMVYIGATMSSWYGLIMYLIYLGAVLVLFFYMFLMYPNLIVKGSRLPPPKLK